MRRLLVLILLLTWATGCSLRPSTAPPVVEASPDSATAVAPAAAPQTTPAAPPSAGVVRQGDGWEVVGVPQAPVWSPDNAWVAFNSNRTGLWAVSADGRTEHQLATGFVPRELVGWWQGALVFIEHHENGDVVAVARPGEPMRAIATVRTQVQREIMSVGPTALYGRYLALFPWGEAALRVDLVSGAVAQLPAETVPAHCGYVVPSRSGRYLLVSSNCEPTPLRLIDLETWTVHDTGIPIAGANWSPVDERWAGLADSYLAVGDADGQVRRIPTPHPMKWRQGPAWSAGGQQLALMEETGPAANGNPRYATCAIWTVSLATGQWRRLADVISTSLWGWHPSGRYLVVMRMDGAATAIFGLLPPDGGEIDWLPYRQGDEAYATQVDEQLLVVANWGVGNTLEREVGGKVIPLRAGQIPQRGSLQIRPPYRSWIYEGGNPRNVALEVQPLR